MIENVNKHKRFWDFDVNNTIIQKGLIKLQEKYPTKDIELSYDTKIRHYTHVVFRHITEDDIISIFLR